MTKLNVIGVIHEYIQNIMKLTNKLTNSSGNTNSTCKVLSAQKNFYHLQSEIMKSFFYSRTKNSL